MNNKLNELNRQELSLFNQYNRHATTDIKLSILSRLIVVINKIEVLKEIQE